MQKLLDDIRTEMDVLKGSIGRMEQRLDELQNKFAELNKLLQTGTRSQTPEAVVRQEIVEEREPIPTRQEVKITEPSSAPVHVFEEQPSPSAILGERIRPATDLRHAVSLNDSFRFTRELFGGDAARMNRVFAELNAAVSFEEAIALFQKEVPVDEENEAVVDFVELLRKCFN